MIFTRTSNNFTATASSANFVETAIYGETNEASTHSFSGTVPTGYTTGSTVTFDIPSEVYEFLAYNASRQREFAVDPYTELESRGNADAFLQKNVPIGLYKGELDLTQEEVSIALSTIDIENQVVFPGLNLELGTQYVLRASISTRTIDFTLLNLSLSIPETVPPSDIRNLYIDSVPFVFESHVDDSTTPIDPSSTPTVRVNAFKVSQIIKDVDVSGWGSNLAVTAELMGEVHRRGHVYANIKKLYEKAIDPFEDQGFAVLNRAGESFIPNMLYGIVNSANAFALIDTSAISYTGMGISIQMSGVMKVTYIVGEINWPSRISFKEEAKTFDIVDEFNSNFTLHGPISGEYIGTATVFPTESMHSWQGRASLGLKTIPLTNVGI